MIAYHVLFPLLVVHLPQTISLGQQKQQQQQILEHPLYQVCLKVVFRAMTRRIVENCCCRWKMLQSRIVPSQNNRPIPSILTFHVGRMLWSRTVPSLLQEIDGISTSQLYLSFSNTIVIFIRLFYYHKDCFQTKIHKQIVVPKCYRNRNETDPLQDPFLPNIDHIHIVVAISY